MNPYALPNSGHYTPGGGWSSAPDPRVKVDPPTDRQVRMLLDALMYRINAEGRRQLMRELPEAYNAYCGYEYVKVMHTDGRPVRKP